MTDKSRRKLLSCGSAGAVAARQYLAATGHADHDGLHRCRDRVAQDLRRLIVQVGTVDEVLFDPLLEHACDDNRGLRRRALLRRRHKAFDAFQPASKAPRSQTRRASSSSTTSKRQGGGWARRMR